MKLKRILKWSAGAISLALVSAALIAFMSGMGFQPMSHRQDADATSSLSL